MSTDYKNQFAYCLLRYRCSGCGNLEIVWNSRDGSIYNQIPCRSCGSVMNHLPSFAMRTPENFSPPEGTFIVIDLTKDIADKTARQMLVFPEGVPKEAQEQQITQLAKELYKNGKEPALAEVPKPEKYVYLFGEVPCNLLEIGEDALIEYVKKMGGIPEDEGAFMEFFVTESDPDALVDACMLYNSVKRLTPEEYERIFSENPNDK